MSAVRMDGKALSAKVRGSILAETEELKKKGVTPGLAVIIVGNDPSRYTGCPCAGPRSMRGRRRTMRHRAARSRP